MLRPIVVALALVSSGALAAAPRHLTLQRSASSPTSVRDCYIWAENPSTNHNSDTLYVGLVGLTDKRSLLRFEVPTNVRVLDARLELIAEDTGRAPFRVHEASQAWTETQPTWTSFADKYQPAVLATVTPSLGRVSIDLTAVAAGWAAGAANHGIMLEQDTMTSPTVFASSERAEQARRPALELVVEDLPPAGGLGLVSTGAPLLEASCGVQLRYPLAVHAPRATSFSVAAGGPAVDAATGELSWKPTRAERGVHTWAVTASDGRETAQLDVTIDVKCAEQLRVACASADGGWLALAAALGALLRRRPRRDR